MAALVANRNTPRLGGDIHVYDAPIKGSTKLFLGSLVCLDANGFLVPGAAATTLRAAGRCKELYDNSAGADGAFRGAYESGVFLWNNSAAGDAIVRADVGKVCYIVDDQTVAKTDGTGTRSKAGVIIDVVAGGVWVETKQSLSAAI